jgi:N-acetylmuramoyl-L-alanine amidase
MPVVGNDRGHGSNTWEETGGKGVKVNGVVYEEHSFNARVGDALSRHLKRCGIGEKSIQGSNKPEVPLTTRTNFYNREKVDVVISNHANWSRHPSVKGICVFAWENHPESQRLQKLLVEEYEKLGFETHGTGEHESEVGSWTNLHIVRETEMTSCLIENGFMSNSDDFHKIFKDPSYAEKCAEAQARALCRFFNIRYVEENKPAAVQNSKTKSVWQPLALVSDQYGVYSVPGTKWKESSTPYKGWIFVARKSKVVKGQTWFEIHIGDRVYGWVSGALIKPIHYKWAKVQEDAVGYVHADLKVQADTMSKGARIAILEERENKYMVVASNRPQWIPKQIVKI